MTRLTSLERDERAITGTTLQRQVVDLAVTLGWSWAHWRPLQDRHKRWRVPVEGPLGFGWPDLTLLRARDHRLIFAEIKKELEKLRPEQERVLEELRSLAWTEFAGIMNGPIVQVCVWRPSDLRDPIEASMIYEILR